MTLRTIQFLLGLGFFVITIQGNEKVPPPEHGHSIVKRIVNGTEGVIGRFPYVVSIRRIYGDLHFCGGAIIDKKWVLTAAHCMFRHTQQINSSTFYVVAGEIQLNATSDRKQRRNIASVYVHPEYNFINQRNDLTLLLVDQAFVFTEDVSPIPLTSVAPVAGTLCVVAGWGRLKEADTSGSNHLMYLDVPILEQTTCKNLLERFIPVSEKQMCAGYLEGKKDTCKGDSGGPLMCEGSLAGVVSFGFGCARARRPGFYTNVLLYKEWIEGIKNSVK